MQASTNSGHVPPTAGLRVLVCGGAGGIGGAIVDGLLGQDARVVVADLGPALDRMSGSVIPRVEMDVADVESVRSGVSAARDVHDGIDAVVHVSGVTGNVPFLDLEPAEWRRVLSVNLDGPYLVGREVATLLAAQGTGGSMTFVTSQLAMRPIAGKSHYVASKSGLEALVRAMALELAPHGIRVNALAPGVTATRMALDRLEASEEAMEWTIGRIPLGRLGRPDELVGAALLLVGRDGSYLTGTTITVDGGYLIG